MDKLKNKPKPSSLYHYTSVEALYNIVDVEKGLLNFHLCNPLQSNDKREIDFFKNYLTNGKTGEVIDARLAELEKIVGNPYTLSLIHERRIQEANHEIAMWEMYGDQSKGIKIRLCYKELKDYCKRHSVKFEQCKYMNHTEMNTIAKDERNLLKQCSFNPATLERVYRDAVFYKSSQWIEENEWRLATWCNDLTKIGFHKNGKSYVAVSLPIMCLKSIEIGPKADQLVVKNGLDILAQKILQKHSIKITIKESKLPIR